MMFCQDCIEADQLSEAERRRIALRLKAYPIQVRRSVRG